MNRSYFNKLDSILISDVIKQEDRFWKEIKEKNHLILREPKNKKNKDGKPLKQIVLTEYDEIYRVLSYDRAGFKFFKGVYSKTIDFLIFIKIMKVDYLILCELKSSNIDRFDINYKFMMTDEFIHLLSRIKDDLCFDIECFKKEYILLHTSKEKINESYFAYHPKTNISEYDKRVMDFHSSLISKSCDNNQIISLKKLINDSKFKDYSPPDF